MHPDVWTNYPDGINHFKSDVLPSQDKEKTVMLECKFCPWTRLLELKEGKFQRWKNPIACRNVNDTGDQVKNAKFHVDGELRQRKKAGASAQPQAEADSTAGMAAAGMANPEVTEGGKRGWHQFWYAVHSLAAAGGAAGGSGPQAPGDRHMMMEYLTRKVKDYRACRNDFEDAGLLVPDGTGAAYGIVDKFSMADEVLRIMSGGSEVKQEVKGPSLHSADEQHSLWGNCAPSLSLPAPSERPADALS